jgi:hypothetical protein
MDKFIILENKVTGERTVEKYNKNEGICGDSFEVCGYGPTRESCITALFWMKPSEPRKPLVVKDHYDKVVECGRRVAYNYQGEARIGYVVGVENVKRGGKLVNYWTKEPYLVISVKETEGGKISKVSNRKNLVVID